MSVIIDGSAGVTTNAGGSVNPSTNVEGINYSCRAWVNFNGTTATPSTIRGSGNVTSVTKNATGDYTVNFTTAMTDVNYAVNITSSIQGTTSTNGGFIPTLSRTSTPAVGSVRLETFTTTFGNTDTLQANVVIFR